MTHASDTAATFERDGGRVRVSGELSFASVPGVLAASDAWFEEDADALEIDLSGIRRSDSAGVALLLEWLRRARAAGRDIRYLGLPPQMRALIDFCALDEVLPLD